MGKTIFFHMLEMGVVVGSVLPCLMYQPWMPLEDQLLNTTCSTLMQMCIKKR
jgi:hypothetical protein